MTGALETPAGRKLKSNNAADVMLVAGVQLAKRFFAPGVAR
jgi:hypothetical protein